MEHKELHGVQLKAQDPLKMEINKVKNMPQPNNTETVEPSLPIEQIRDCIQKSRRDAMKVDENFANMVSKIIKSVGHNENDRDKNSCSASHFDDKKKLTDGDTLPNKNFEIRNSMLIDLCNEVKHVKTLYNIFIAVLIILFINTAVHDFFETGTLRLGFSTMKSGLRGVPYVAKMWIQMMALSIAAYFFYTVWAEKRMKLQPKSYRIKFWDCSWLCVLIIYQLAFLIIPSRIIMSVHLPPPSACILLFEQLRMIMKVHAFIRSTAPLIISYKPHTEKEQSPVPEFSKFIYFMFAPTIVYRDNYPRTKNIRWGLVTWFFFEFFMTFCCTTFMFERYVIPVYKDYGLEPYDRQKFILRYFSTILPSTIIFVCGFYCLLHAWMNAFAEMMRFGDRLFYKDWWNSKSYAVFYRTWNVVVHDWLYVYIYKDVYEIIAPRNKFLAQFSVFFISAIFHEYIIGFALHLFYPIMLVTFGGLGFFFVIITRRSESAFGNIFLWLSLSTGSGLLVSLYATEYFARINCQSQYDGIYNLLIPRLWQCYI